MLNLKESIQAARSGFEALGIDTNGKSDLEIMTIMTELNVLFGRLNLSAEQGTIEMAKMILQEQG